MANPEHVEILKQGAEVWNKWRKENPEIRPDLNNAVFDGKQFDDINFCEAHLDNTIFNACYLDRADFSLAFMTGTRFYGGHAPFADLSSAYINQCAFMTSNFTHSNFSETVLVRTTFLEVNLSSSSFMKTFIGNCTFSRASMLKVTGLENVELAGPSTIGIDTIYLSKGEIPESFLRGCGVPEDFIKLIPSLTSQPIQYYSCFISYSSMDDDFAHRLYNDLQGKGVRCWFAPEDMKIGDRIRHRIDQSIRLHDKLLLILSQHSISSQWVEKEVETAFEKERRNPGKTVLFPIRVDDAVMDSDEAWAADIRRTRNIGDFSNWKDHDSYQKAFDRLMRDLKASEE